jgi:tRNA A37 threonylcarbamoyladenosine synthetase subunit TsaC/SUA5/YrdC
LNTRLKEGSPVVWPGFSFSAYVCGVHQPIFDQMSSLHLDMCNAATVDELLRVMHSDFPVAVVQLPAVFALIAPSTPAGVAALNKAKNRLSGKHYGSAIGDLSAFAAMSQQENLPDDFRENMHGMQVLEGAFIRLRVADSRAETVAVSMGTHQGLLLPEGMERTLFRAIEQAFVADGPNEVYAGARYYAPLCTSANLSGDPFGSIVDLERAHAFVNERNIPLFISNKSAHSEETGSYPIFSFEKNTVTIMRSGPNQERILRALPSSITVC